MSTSMTTLSGLVRAVRSAAVTVAVLCSACGEGPDDKAPGGPAVGIDERGPATPIDHTPVDPGKIVKSASTRRLSVQQLRWSLPKIFGVDAADKPITWMVGTNEGLTRFDDPLGDPDFLDTTEEGLEPSPLYLKFMDDAARDVCNRALLADAEKASKADRVLLRHVEPVDTAESAAAAVAENLRYLKLRFHGVYVAKDDQAGIAPLLALFADATAAAAATEPPAEEPATEGWRAVCVGLVLSPEFHLY
jgi:hypothetical protein